MYKCLTFNSKRNCLATILLLVILGFCNQVVLAQVLNGYYKGNDNGHYYVRTVGNQVYWFGEHQNGNWANVFLGTLTGNRVNGTFYDIPKGGAKGSGALVLEINTNGNAFTKISGVFNGTIWNKMALPTSGLPGNRDRQFGSSIQSDLTGRWTCNDGGKYYIRQIGNSVAWFGESSNTNGRPNFANVAVGTRNQNSLTLQWVDLPKCGLNGMGTLQLSVSNINTISKISGSGFTGSQWIRDAVICPNSVVDIDGNRYNTVLIGTQCWTKENLKVARYRNGAPIPSGLNDAAWSNTTSGAYAIQNNDMERALKRIYIFI